MRILIADTTWNSMIAAKALADAGLLLTRANDGQELFEYADLSAQNVILFDADLPDIGPLDCLRRLRAEHPETGIVLMADETDMAFRLRALQLGADDVVSRKVKSGELVARVQAIARRRSGHAAPVFEIEGLQIDTLSRQARVGGKALPLTRMEYELLELLAMRTGQIVDKDRIMAQLYALGDAPDIRIIGVYIHHIRAKIAAFGGNPSILENVRGRGYSLMEAMPQDVAA